MQTCRSFIGDFPRNDPLRLLCRHHHRLDCRIRKRRPTIGESTDARQVLIRRTRHRGTSQDEGEGEDEADGPHWQSPVPCRRLRRFVGNLIAVGCFRTSTPKAQNGFMAQGNCFVGLLGRNIGAKNPMNSAEQLAANLWPGRTGFEPGRRVLNGLRRKKPLANGRWRVNRSIARADSIELRATFRLLARCELSSTKDSSRGQWQHRCWQ